MKRINREEYEVLKELDDKWKWIARDSDTSLWVYKTKPIKCGGSIGWEDPVIDHYHRIYTDQFNFVRWEDEKPYSIAELVEEYEDSAEHVSHGVNEKVKALGKAWEESEETEVKKDIEWLKEEMEKWTLDINIVDTRDEDNYTVNNWIMLEGVTLIQATNIISDTQKYAKLEEHEKLNFIIAKEEEKENKTVTCEEVDKELEMRNLTIRVREEE